jgi:hypothetical protein
MRKQRSWLGIPLEKKWHRRVFVCVLYALLFSLIPLRFVVGPGPMRPSLVDNPFPLIILSSLLSLFVWKLRRDRSSQGFYSPVVAFGGVFRRRSTALPPGAMDERERAMHESAHVWAYNTLCVLYVLGLAGYFAMGGNIPKVVAHMAFDTTVIVGPLLLLTLPNAIEFWMAPDWLEEPAQPIAEPVQNTR